MSTNHTPNYNLSQWEHSDKVLMDDFNADNANIDTALSDIDRRAGMKLIREAVLKTSGNNLGIPLEGIPWEQYGLIVVAFDPVLGSGSSVDVSFCSCALGKLQRPMAGSTKYVSARIIGAPMFHESTNLVFSTMGFAEDKIFNSTVGFGDRGGATMNGYNMGIGSTIQIWGFR